MSSYTLSGDDAVFFGGKNIFQKIGGAIASGAKSLVKLDETIVTKAFIEPVKLLYDSKTQKAASKTLARFDPTAKNAKYGNVTKGVIIASAAVGAAALTGGAGLALLGAAVPGLTTAVKGAVSPYKPPKTIAPDPLNSLTNIGVQTDGTNTLQNNSAPGQNNSALGHGISTPLLIGGAVVALAALLYFSSSD